MDSGNYLLAISIAALLFFIIILIKLFLAERGLIVYIIVAFLSFLLIPHALRVKIFNIAYATFALGGGVIFFLGETKANPSQSVIQTLHFLMGMGLLLIYPWAIAFAFKYGFSPIGELLKPLPNKNPEFSDYLIWFVVKVVLIVIASRLLDNWLANRGKGIFVRISLRTLMIWILSFFPFPRVFSAVFGEMLVSTALSQVIDGMIDLAIIRESLTGLIFVFVSTGLVLFTIPGIYALYSDTLGSPLGVILSVFFVFLASRVYFVLAKYEFIVSS